MNALELQQARGIIQGEIDITVQDQGNHAELSYMLLLLTTDKVVALLERITELRSSGEGVSYDLLSRAIGEEETIS